MTNLQKQIYRNKCASSVLRIYVSGNKLLPKGFQLKMKAKGLIMQSRILDGRDETVERAIRDEFCK